MLRKQQITSFSQTLGVITLDLNQKILLLPEKSDVERDSVAQAWVNSGGIVRKINRFWIKPELENTQVSLYGNDTFVLVLAQLLEIELLTPDDRIIASFDKEWIKRNLTIIPVVELDDIEFPCFIKPVKPKLFDASVFNSKQEFNEIVGELEEELLIVSEIIKIQSEVRSFILDGNIVDLSYYEGNGDLDSPKLFIEEFLKENKDKLPKSFVLDVGFNDQIGWFIIELNASWGAGLNGCDPSLVLNCIQVASGNQ